MLVTPEMKRKMELARYTNNELLNLYVETELKLRINNERNLTNDTRLLSKYLIEYLGGYPPTALNAKSFLSTFYGNKKLTTLRRAYSTINSLLTWLGHDLNMKIKIPKILPKFHDPATIMQLHDKIKSKRTHKGNIDRDLMLIDLACASGLRAAELSKLRPCDVHGGFLEVIGGKGNKDRRVIVPKGIGNRLLEFTQDMDPYEPIFKLTDRSISNKIYLWAKKAGVKVNAHALRHYYATQLYQSSKDIQAVQFQLGHSSVGTTERYLGLQQQQIQQAVDSLSLEGEENEQPTGKSRRKRQWTSDNLGFGESKQIIEYQDDPEWVKELNKDSRMPVIRLPARDHK